eukprot:s2143_g4.t1
MKRLRDSYTMPGKLREILNLERQIAVVQLLLETAIEVEDWLEYQEFDHIVPPMLKARESLMEVLEDMKFEKLQIVMDFEEDLERALAALGNIQWCNLLTQQFLHQQTFLQLDAESSAQSGEALAQSQPRLRAWISELGDQEACQGCGLSTHSWCEGCYQRNEGRHSGFSAICRQCDADKIVCPLCLEGGFDWDSGHRAYINAHGEEDQEVIEVSVDPSDPPVRIRLSDWAASAGISVEKLRSELFASLGGSGLQGR